MYIIWGWIKVIIKKIKKLNYKHWSFVGLVSASIVSVILSFTITASKNVVEESNIKSKVDFISQNDLKVQKEKYNIDKIEFEKLAENLHLKAMFLNSISAHQLLEYHANETALNLLNELVDFSNFEKRWPNYYFYLKINKELVVSKTGYEINGLSLIASNINGEIILETTTKVKGFSTDKVLENVNIAKTPSKAKSLIYVTGKSKLAFPNPKIAAITLQYLFDSYNKLNSKKQSQNNITQTLESNDSNLNVVNKNNENQALAFKQAITDIGTIMLFDEKGNLFNLDKNKLMIPKLDDGGRLIFKALKDDKIALASQIIGKQTNQLLFELDLPLIFSQSLVANNLQIIRANLKDYKINTQLVKTVQDLGFNNLSEIINANVISKSLMEKPFFENKNINEIKSFNFWFKNNRTNDSQKTQNPLKISYFFTNPVGILKNNILLNAVFDFSVEGKNIKIPEGISFDVGSSETITSQAIANFNFSNYKGSLTTTLDEKDVELISEIQEIKKEIKPIFLDTNSRVFANQIDDAFKLIKTQLTSKNIDNLMLPLTFLLNQASRKSKISNQLAGDYLKNIFSKITNLITRKVKIKIQNIFAKKYQINLQISNAGQLIDTIELEINDVLPTNQAFDAAISLAPDVFIDQNSINVIDNKVVSFDNLASLQPAYFSNKLNDKITKTANGINLTSELTIKSDNLKVEQENQIIHNGAIYLAFKPSSLPTNPDERLYLLGSGDNVKDNSINVFIQKIPANSQDIGQKVSLEDSYYIGLEYLDKKENSSSKKVIKALYSMPNVVLNKKNSDLNLPDSSLEYNYKGTESLTDYFKNPDATLLLEILLFKNDMRVNLWTSDSKDFLNNYISSKINWNLPIDSNKDLKEKIIPKSQSNQKLIPNYGVDISTIAYKSQSLERMKSFISLKGLAIFNNNSQQNNFENLANRLKVIQGFINQYFD